MSNSIKSIISIEESKRFDDFIFMRSVDSPIVKSFFRYIFVFVNEAHSENKDKAQYKTEVSLVGNFELSSNFTS